MVLSPQIKPGGKIFGYGDFYVLEFLKMPIAIFYLAIKRHII